MTAELLKSDDVDAIEIHTTGKYVSLVSVILLVELTLTFPPFHFSLDLIYSDHCRGTDMFNTLWDNLSGSINNVKLVAVGSTFGLLLYPHICIAGNVASDFLLKKKLPFHHY